MKHSLKAWMAGICVFFMFASGVAHAALITTGQLLNNPNFTGNTLTGWSTAGGVIPTSMYVNGQWVPAIYSKTSSFSARQTIDLSAGLYNTGLIDSGMFRYDATTWQQGYSGDSDRGRLVMYFYDANNVLLQASTLGYRDTNAASKTDLTGYIPTSTRRIVYSLEGVRYGGTDNNALFAQNGLTFSAETSALSLHGGYFIQGQQVIPVAPEQPTTPVNVSAPAMTASGLLLMMLGLRRRRSV